MSDYEIVVVMRADSTSSQLKRFAKAVDDWQEEAQSRGIGLLTDPVTMNDLDQGELPMPLAVRESIGPYQIPAELIELVKQRGGDLSAITEQDRERLGAGFPAPKPGAIREARERLGESASLRGVRIWYPREAVEDRETLVRELALRLPRRPIDYFIVDGVRISEGL